MDKASFTAELAAMARASQAKEPLPCRGSDTMAAQLLSAPLRLVVELEPLRRLVLGVMVSKMPGAYAEVLCRTHFGDDFVARELASGATQFVVLGAGYDTRAYRLRERIAGKARVFEVDASPTSRRKRARVERVLGALPEHVSYVEVDFDRETMEGPLRRAGYDPSARTVFTWEGVTFYLTRDAVAAVLSFVATGAGPRSAIVFDYLYRSVLDGTSPSPAAAKHVAYVRARGEPFKFGIEPDDVDAFVAAQGLAVEENALPEALTHRYLEGAPTAHLRAMAPFYGIAVARKR